MGSYKSINGVDKERCIVYSMMEFADSPLIRDKS